jgi:hypothetical protein
MFVLFCFVLFAGNLLNGLAIDNLLFGCCRIPAYVDEKFTAPTKGYVV